MSTRRTLILAAIDDLVLDLLVYDRKNDEELPTGSAEKAVAAGEITTTEMVNQFRKTLMEYL